MKKILTTNFLKKISSSFSPTKPNNFHNLPKLFNSLFKQIVPRVSNKTIDKLQFKLFCVSSCSKTQETQTSYFWDCQCTFKNSYLLVCKCLMVSRLTPHWIIHSGFISMRPWRILQNHTDSFRKVTANPLKTLFFQFVAKAEANRDFYSNANLVIGLEIHLLLQQRLFCIAAFPLRFPCSGIFIAQISM